MLSASRRDWLLQQIVASQTPSAMTGSLYATPSDAPQSTDPLDGYRVNSVKSLVYMWYALFEIHTRPMSDRILALCAESFLLNMGSTSIRNTHEFRTWYNSLFGTFRRSLHDIRRLDIRLRNLREAEVDVVYVHTVTTGAGATVTLHYRARIQVVEHSLDCGPLVAFYEPIPTGP